MVFLKKSLDTLVSKTVYHMHSVLIKELKQKKEEERKKEREYSTAYLSFHESSVSLQKVLSAT